MIDITRHATIRGAYTLKSEQWLPRARDEVFAFFADAHRLQDLTPPFLNFQVLTPSPIEMDVGTRIDYRLRLHGIPIRWQSEISEWDPPFSFADRQLKGPYRLWHHRHLFEEQNSGTLVRDLVDYSVPGGRLIHWLLVRKDLIRIFTYRHQQLNRFFPSSSPEIFGPCD